MKVSLRFLSLAIALTTAACSGGGSTNDAGTDASKEAGGKEAGVKDSGTTPDADDGGQTGPTIDPACATPSAPASGGSCVTLDDAGVSCNPVTSATCATDAGESCDFSQTGFQCYPPPPPNTAALCAACDPQNGPECAPTSTCIATPNGNECARFCCTDADCTPGKCDTTTFQSAPLGFCVK